MLQSLAAQQCELTWEIILVDNDSSDGAIEACRPLFARLNLRLVAAMEKGNASYARNVGAREARGSKLLFVDADDEIAPGYIAAMAAALDEHDFVTSRVDSTSLNVDWVRDAHGPPWQESGLVKFFDFLPGTGSNIGLSKPLFGRVGPLPEELDASEDIAFSWHVQLTFGVKLHFVADALYRYRYRHSLGGLFRQSKGWGRSNVLLYKKFRQAGMPGRSLQMARAEWVAVLKGLCRARNRQELAPMVVRAGYCLGRISGSLRYGVLYV